MGVKVNLNIVEDTLKYQLDKDFYELIELVVKESEENRFDTLARSRFDDDGGCNQENLNVKEYGKLVLTVD